jgi:hypothetical protein
MRQYFQAYCIEQRIYPDILPPIPEGQKIQAVKKEKGKVMIKRFGEWIFK